MYKKRINHKVSVCIYLVLISQNTIIYDKDVGSIGEIISISINCDCFLLDLKLILQYAEIIKGSTFNCTVSQDGHHGINLNEMKHLSNAFALTPLESLNYQ